MNKLSLWTILLLLLAPFSGAQNPHTPEERFWPQRFRLAQSRLARDFVFQAAAKKADETAIQFLESWAKLAPQNSNGLVALKALSQIPAYPFTDFLMKIVHGLSRKERQLEFLRYLTRPSAHRDAGYRRLLNELELHQGDSFGFLILDVIQDFFDNPPTKGVEELEDLLLAIFEENPTSPLRQSVFKLSPNLSSDFQQRIHVSALLQVDPMLAKKASESLMASGIDGIEDLLVSTFLANTKKFYQADLDFLIREDRNLLLRLRFLDQADDMTWQQLGYLHASLPTTDTRKMKSFLASALHEGSTKKKILALWMIRDQKHMGAISTMRRLQSQELPDSVAMLLNETLATLTGEKAYFSAVKKILSTRNLDRQLQHLDLARRVRLKSSFSRAWLRSALRTARSDWKVKGHLIRLAGAMELEETIAICEDALKHKRWQVRLGAIEALVSLGTRPALTRLAALSNDPQQRLARMASDGLRGLTGANLGANPDGWRRLIATLGRNWTPSRTPIRDRASGGSERYGPQFYGLDLRSNRVIFICDTSGSMAGSKIERLKTELLRGVKSIVAPESAFNLIFFAGNVNAVWKRLAHLRKNTVSKASWAIDRIYANGGTNVWDALERAYSDPAADTIVLLTDGQPSVGKITAPDLILAQIRKANRYKRLQIHTIYLAEDTSSPIRNVTSSQTASFFMRQLATIGDGQFIEVR